MSMCNPRRFWELLTSSRCLGLARSCNARDLSCHAERALLRWHCPESGKSDCKKAFSTSLSKCHRCGRSKKDSLNNTVLLHESQ